MGYRRGKGGHSDGQTCIQTGTDKTGTDRQAYRMGSKGEGGREDIRREGRTPD